MAQVAEHHAEHHGVREPGRHRGVEVGVGHGPVRTHERGIRPPQGAVVAEHCRWIVPTRRAQQNDRRPDLRHACCGLRDVGGRAPAGERGGFTVAGRLIRECLQFRLPRQQVRAAIVLKGIEVGP